jgi:homoprotocatechuate degradation regulator HpaR
MATAPLSPADSAALRHRNLPLLLLQAREALMAQFRPALKAEGLTDQQWRIVRALFDAEQAGSPSLEPRQLGQQVQISSPSMAGVLARMEELHLLTRERFAEDQRRVAVRLSTAGRRLARKLVAQVEARYQQLEAEIGVPVMHEVYDMLDLLITHLKGDASAELPEASSADATAPASNDEAGPA